MSERPLLDVFKGIARPRPPWWMLRGPGTGSPGGGRPGQQNYPATQVGDAGMSRSGTAGGARRAEGEEGHAPRL